MNTHGVPGYDKGLPLFMQDGRERAHLDSGTYRHEVRRAAVALREYKLKAYLIDSTNPTTETVVDLSDPVTYTIGKCNDPGNAYEQHIAFVVSQDEYQDFVTPGTVRNYSHILQVKLSFSAIYYNPPDAAHKTTDGGRAYLGVEQNAWAGSGYTWNNKPASPSADVSITALAGTSGVVVSNISGGADLWNLALLGTSYTGRGFRLYPTVQDSSGHAYTETIIALSAWRFLCE